MGAGGAGGSVVVPPASGGSPGTGGAGVSNPGNVAGAGGVGGSPAMGGMPGAGSSPSASGGSTYATDINVCSSDADCTMCTWGTDPTDSSQCTGSYCCGGWVTTTARCEANQAAWTAYCPDQFPNEGECACPATGCPGQAVAAIACVGGQCGLSCSAAGGSHGGSLGGAPVGEGGSGVGGLLTAAGGGASGGTITGMGGGGNSGGTALHDAATAGCNYNGGSYALGATFLTTNGCHHCTCGISGITCDTQGVAVSCGVGCYQCIGASNYGYHESGTTFPAGDGCNTCTCLNAACGCTHDVCLGGDAGDVGGTIGVSIDAGTADTVSTTEASVSMIDVPLKHGI